jgi:CRP/FNR family transcriptional regulator, cyclic AMP receptor protein
MRKALQILGVLNDSDLEWLVTNGERRIVSADTIVIRQGQPVGALSIVLAGRLSVRASHAQTQEIATMFSGEIIGEISFVDARVPSASVIALEESQLLCISSDKLARKLEQDNAFSSRFYRAIAIFLADRLRTTTGRLGYGAPEQDISHDEIDEQSMENIDIAARRFDNLLKRTMAS